MRLAALLNKVMILNVKPSVSRSKSSIKSATPAWLYRDKGYSTPLNHPTLNRKAAEMSEQLDYVTKLIGKPDK
jgi:hypothetical protein